MESKMSCFAASTPVSRALSSTKKAAVCVASPKAKHRATRRPSVRCNAGQTLQQTDSSPVIPSPAQIKLVASDVDGTLLNNEHAVSDKNAQAIRTLLASGSTDFVLATGKSRSGGYAAMGADLANDIAKHYGGHRPGVFLQGLLVYGRNGELIFERRLSKEMSSRVVKLAHENDITFIAYCGDRILCETTDQYTDDLQTYHEPVAEAMGDFDKEVIPNYTLHKFLLLAPADVVSKVRPIVEAAISPSEATIVQALPTMLEVLPPGASKGLGVQALLKDFGLAPRELLACGDAENDLEMLRLAGLGCAVANASEQVKEAADIEILSNVQNGVAYAIEKYALGK